MSRSQSKPARKASYRSPVQQPKGEAMEQLAELREMTRRTGILHDAQIAHMKLWPRVVFANADEVGIHIKNDVEPKKVFRVDYRVKMKKGKGTGTQPKKRYEALDAWTKELLGPEWEVVIHIGTSQVFRGPPKK